MRSFSPESYAQKTQKAVLTRNPVRYSANAEDDTSASLKTPTYVASVGILNMLEAALKLATFRDTQNGDR
jgi:hypothetical protein